MSSMERESGIRRILVALDASPHSLAALEAAAELAVRLRAELTGLFVEDADLLNVAGLPFARQVGAFSTGSRRLDTRRVEHQLRNQAEKARQALETTAERAQVRWSFRVTRGQVAAEVSAATADTDLLIMGQTGWSPGRRRRLGNTAQDVLSRTSCLAMVLRQGMRLGVPVIALYDGGPASQRALGVALQLVQEKQGSLKVLLVAPRVSDARFLQDQVGARLGKSGMEREFQMVVGATGEELVRAVKDLGQGLLVLGESELLTGERLQTLIDATECPALVVRPQRG